MIEILLSPPFPVYVFIKLFFFLFNSNSQFDLKLGFSPSNFFPMQPHDIFVSYMHGFLRDSTSDQLHKDLVSLMQCCGCFFVCLFCTAVTQELSTSDQEMHLHLRHLQVFLK